MSLSASVVMAVHNGDRFLAEQLGSVLPQLDANDEIIAIDDRSTDGSGALLTAAGCGRVRVLRNDLQLGVVRSFERGLQVAGRDIVFLCDQDDVWLPGKRTAFVAAFAANPAVCVVISDAEVIDGEGRRLSRSFMADRGGFDGSVFGTLWRNRYLGCAMAVRRTFLALALPIPVGVPMHDMWLGLLGSVLGRVTYLPATYLKYRRHERNVTPTRSTASCLQMLRWRVALALAIGARTVAVRSGLRKHESQ